jgi:hypothetical protein
MPHLMCRSCGTALYSAAREADLIDPDCPACGASCDPMRGGLDADRWLDDGGSFGLTAAASAPQGLTSGWA